MIVSIAGLKKYSGVTDNIISHRILLVHMYHLWNNALRQNIIAPFTGHHGPVIPQHFALMPRGYRHSNPSSGISMCNHGMKIYREVIVQFML